MISYVHDIQQKHREKSLLLRKLKASRRQQISHDDTATDSDDSEIEVRKSMGEKKFFETKRMMDRASTGRFLKKRMLVPANYNSIGRLLPLADSEVEVNDSSDHIIHSFQRNGSDASIQTQDSTTDQLAATLEPSQSRNSDAVIEELSRIGSGDEVGDFYIDDVDVDTSCGKRKNKYRFVRFADDHGEKLEIVYWTPTMYSVEENDWVRLIILLLCPRKKMFEFLHVSYNIYDKTNIGDIVKQLPTIATDEALKCQRYVGLVRRDGERELINSVCIQSYKMKRKEMLIAVVDGFVGKSILRLAKPLLADKKMVKMVTRTKSKRVVVTQLKPVRASSKKRDCSEVLSISQQSSGEIGGTLSICQEQDEDFGLIHATCKPLSEEDHDDDMPEMSSSFSCDTCVNERHRSNVANETLRDKVHLTRFLNAGLMTAMIFGLNKKPRR